MSGAYFFYVTVDCIPEDFRDRKVKNMVTQWHMGDSIKEAVGGLLGWAKEREYDGVIGLKIEPVVSTHGSLNSMREWLAYGTLIKFL
jgi:hypothetical protein